MKLDESSIRWSLSHLWAYGDTDLFPRPAEFDVLQGTENQTVQRLKDIDIDPKSYKLGPSRRFVVPKDELSYRLATQLDPLDTIILTAMMHQFGGRIEAKRVQSANKNVFSYRFAPQSDFALFDPKTGWIEFWETIAFKSHSYTHAVYLDVADYYNQIYHCCTRTLEAHPQV